MKITVRQLKQLIREQVEMAMSEGSSDAHAAVILKQIEGIWREEAGVLASPGSETHNIWKNKAEELSHVRPQELIDALEEQKKQAKEFFAYLKML